MLEQDKDAKAPLEAIEGDIKVVDREQRTLLCTCEARGDAIWARWNFLYPVIVTARKFVAYRAGVAQDVSIETVIPPMGSKPLDEPEYGEDVPRVLKTGELNILAQSEGAESIVIELRCRIDHSPEQPAASRRVEATRTALMSRMSAHHRDLRTTTAFNSVVDMDEDPPKAFTPPVPLETLPGLSGLTPPSMRIPPEGIPDGVTMPMSDIPPDMQAAVTKQFAEMGQAGADLFQKVSAGDSAPGFVETNDIPEPEPKGGD